MCVIETNRELKLNNLLSLRKKMTQSQIQEEMQKIGMFLKDKNIGKNGPVVTTTFSIEQNDSEQIIDMEILVPLKEEQTFENGYIFKKAFHLTNAVYSKHKGNPNLVQNTYNQMNTYISENGLQPITTGYNININELKQGDSMDDMEMDIYIGVNPNIL